MVLRFFLCLMLLSFGFFSCRSKPSFEREDSSSEREMDSEAYRTHVLKTLKIKNHLRIIMGAQNNEKNHDFSDVDLCLNDRNDHMKAVASHKPLMLEQFDFNKEESLNELAFLKGRVKTLKFDFSTA